MADIAAGNVTYTVKNSRTLGDSRKSLRVQLVFGDGALTYPAGGIPITIGSLGCPTIVESMNIVAQGTSGYVFKYIQSTAKLAMWLSNSLNHTHDIKVIASVTADSTIGSNGSTLGKNSATNLVIAGANSTASGGVVSATLAAAALLEASTVAIAAQTIEVEVIGW